MPKKTKVTFNIAEIKMVYDYLNTKEQELVSLYYFDNLTLTAIAKKYGVSQPTITKKMARIHTKINNILTNKEEVKIKRGRKPQENAIKRRYTKKEILEVIDYFKDTNKTILTLYYGLNNKYYTLKDISKELNITFQAVQKRLKRIHEKIAILLMGEDINNIHKKFTKEQIELIIPYLTGIDQKIFTLYYGLNTKEHYITKISQIINLSQGQIYSIIKNLNNKITDILTTYHFKTITSKPYKRPYSIDQVKRIINNFSGYKKEILALYYGTEDYPHTKSSISLETGFSIYIIEQIIRETNDQIKYLLALDTIKFYLGNHPHALKCLSLKANIILNLKYQEGLSINQIATKLNMPLDTVKEILITSLETLKQNFEQEKIRTLNI